MRGAKRLNLGPANGRSAESVLRSAKLPRQPRRQSATGGDANDRSVTSFLAPLRLNLMTRCCGRRAPAEQRRGILRSEDHTSELQSLMRISSAAFCLKNKIKDKK